MPLGDFAPVKSAIFVRPFGKPSGGDVNWEAALALPPAQPFTAGKAAPKDALKPVASPDGDQASGPMLGSRRFKGGAHRGNGMADVPNPHPFCHVILSVLHSPGMASSSSRQGFDPHKKGGQAVEVPVEVLGAEEQRTAPGSDYSQRGAPREAGPARTPFGKSPAFRSMVSLAVGMAADGLEVAFPPAWVVIDAFATLAFFLIWGLRWEIAVVLLPELVPGMNVFPSWTLLAMYLEKKGADNV
jgi:hypothetical protein